MSSITNALASRQVGVIAVAVQVDQGNLEASLWGKHSIKTDQNGGDGGVYKQIPLALTGLRGSQRYQKLNQWTWFRTPCTIFEPRSQKSINPGWLVICQLAWAEKYLYWRSFLISVNFICHLFRLFTLESRQCYAIATEIRAARIYVEVNEIGILIRNSTRMTIIWHDLCGMALKMKSLHYVLLRHPTGSEFVIQLLVRRSGR